MTFINAGCALGVIQPHGLEDSISPVLVAEFGNLRHQVELGRFARIVIDEDTGRLTGLVLQYLDPREAWHCAAIDPVQFQREGVQRHVARRLAPVPRRQVPGPDRE